MTKKAISVCERYVNALMLQQNLLFTFNTCFRTLIFTY